MPKRNTPSYLQLSEGVGVIGQAQGVKVVTAGVHLQG